MTESKNRVAIVTGLRTPFAKQGTVYKNLSALNLGSMVVSELLQRVGVSPKSVQRVVYGQVIPSLDAPNIAREIVLNTGMPRDIDAYSVACACTTSYQSSVSIAESILSGKYKKFGGVSPDSRPGHALEWIGRQIVVHDNGISF